MVCAREFLVADAIVFATENDGDGGVGAKGLVVGGGHGATVGGVGAAEEGDAFGTQFGLNPGFANNVDSLGGGEAEDAGDVDGGGVGGAEDFVLLGGLVRGHRGEEVGK